MKYFSILFVVFTAHLPLMLCLDCLTLDEAKSSIARLIREHTTTRRLNNSVRRELDRVCSCDEPVIRDCSDAVSGGQRSGVYNIRPEGADREYSVYCEVTNDGIYTYIQQRVSDQVDFYQNWQKYKDGFGNIEEDGDFYVGNELIHLITSQRSYTLQVDLLPFDDEWDYASYTHFELADEDDGYRLSLGDYSGTAGDGFRSHYDMMFSTFDRDQDMDEDGNCAVYYPGGWWYNECVYSNLNSYYRNTPVVGYCDGIYWLGGEGGRTAYTTEKRVDMKIKPN